MAVSYDILHGSCALVVRRIRRFFWRVELMSLSCPCLVISVLFYDGFYRSCSHRLPLFVMLIKRQGAAAEYDGASAFITYDV